MTIILHWDYKYNFTWIPRKIVGRCWKQNLAFNKQEADVEIEYS